MSQVPSNLELVVGQTIVGKYQIVRTLGAGGMALVYEAVHVGLDRRVAIKMLAGAMVGNEPMAHRFRREARAIAQIQSPYVARVLDIDAFANGHPFIVLELLTGNDLGDEIDRRSALSIDEATDFVRQAAMGMSAAHTAGVVHRDLKPANIFLCNPVESDGRRVAKILDFGISKIVHDDDDRRITRASEAFGTPHYMSPEQIRNARDVDARADVWALGVVLYECLTGRTPYEGEATEVIAAIVSEPVPSPRKHNGAIPPQLEAVVMRALERTPSARFQTAAELADALTPWAPHLPVVASAVPSRTPFKPLPLSELEAAPPSGSTGRDVAPSSAGARRPDRIATSMTLTHAPAAPSRSARGKLWIALGGGTLLVAVVILAIGMGNTPATPRSPPIASPASAPSAAPNVEAPPVKPPSIVQPELPPAAAAHPAASTPVRAAAAPNPRPRAAPTPVAPSSAAPPPPSPSVVPSAPPAKRTNPIAI